MEVRMQMDQETKQLKLVLDFSQDDIVSDSYIEAQKKIYEESFKDNPFTVKIEVIK